VGLVESTAEIKKDNDKVYDVFGKSVHQWDARERKNDIRSDLRSMGTRNQDGHQKSAVVGSHLRRRESNRQHWGRGRMTEKN